MAGKYRKLSERLNNLATDQETLTFAQIEDILGTTLPPSARVYAAWWSNQAHNHAAAWVGAGWKTKNVNLRTGSVTFVRTAPLTAASHQSLSKLRNVVATLTGLKRSQIQITFTP